MITVAWRWHQTGSYKEYSLSYQTGDVANLTTLITNIASKPKHFRKKPPESRQLFKQYFNADKVLDEFADYLEGFASEFNP